MRGRRPRPLDEGGALAILLRASLGSRNCADLSFLLIREAGNFDAAERSGHAWSQIRNRMLGEPHEDR